MTNVAPQTIELIIAAVVALALLSQAIVLVAIFFGMRKAISSARAEFEDFRASAMPLFKDARGCFVRVAPKVEETTADLAALIHTLRTRTDEAQVAASEIIESARRQANRIDVMTTNVLDAADRAAAFTSHAVGKPVRQVSGILASIKAVIETLRAPETNSRAHANHGAGDPDMFV
jgi:methyl-accepting chemotaxis protein